MADIRSYPMARHLRGAATLHVRHLRRGKLVHDGTGLSFFFRPLSAVLSEVPVDDRELPLLFHARTADFQDLAVQASVTFRVTDPATACARIDFSLDPDTGRWRGTPLEQVAGLLTETAQQQVLGMIARSPLASVLADGVGADPGPDPGRADRRSAAGRDRDRGHRRPGDRDPARAGRGEGAADPGPGADAAGGGPGHLRAAGPGRRA